MTTMRDSVRRFGKLEIMGLRAPWGRGFDLFYGATYIGEK
jgi:hypothetical protein